MSADAAAAYDAWYATPPGAAAHALELVVVEGLARPRAGERALDIGCGTGIYTAWLAASGVEVTGIDIDSARLDAARRKLPKVTFLHSDATALPFADRKFDLVLAVTLLCFLDEHRRQAAVAELVRVTRPGGRIVIGELARASLWAGQRRLKGWRGSATWRRAHFTTAGELRGLLAAAGAGSVETRYGLYLPPWSARPVVARASTIERIARPLGPLGAAFVAARGERPSTSPASSSPTGSTGAASTTRKEQRTP